jgi:2,4-dienoyl-CoA reductase-like NADH-dependent reductase (Old Yellow Enzyme family)
MPSLFDPWRVRSLTLRNRIGVSPMCMYSATDGLPNDWHLAHLGSRAVGGAGLVIAEATGVLPEGRITLGCTGLWSDAHTLAWSRIAAFIKAQGAVAGIQLAHAGRKASTALPKDGGASLANADGGWDTVGPSALAFGGPLTKVPMALDQAGIDKVVAGFAAAAQRALDAGFEWIQVHAAHGYLLHQFLSPLSNQRTDAYGGSLDHRMKLALDVARAIRDVVPDSLPLSFRLSATDWTDGGWDLPQAIELAKRLKGLSVDVIDVSSGGNVHDAKIAVGPGYQVPFAAAIRQQAQIATSAVGLITEPAQAAAIIESGQADQVLLARAMLRDPHWAKHAAIALGQPDAVKYPAQYGRA